jgi:zinc protease
MQNVLSRCPRTFAALFAAVLLVTVGRHEMRAQQPAAQPRIDPQAMLPLDPAVRAGTLPNGLKYYIRRNGRPEKRVSLRLAVKSGSLEEEDDQQGLAHLIEHMAFNGSEHFKPGELISYFERVGARLGPHVNAYTSFDETVYMLDLPTDQSEVVARGVTALADFAGGLTLDPTEIDKERGVVIEEWRGGLGAASRVRDKQIPVIFYNSRYAQRLPIGKPEILRTAPAARLRAYYDTWYRPERQAVIIAGDIDPAAMEETIRSAFTPLRARAAARPVPDAAVTLRHPLLVSVVTDPELTRSSVQILRKRARPGNSRVADYRRSVVERLVQMMLDDRFTELSRKPDAPFLGAGAGSDSLTPAVDAFTLAARTQDGKIDGAAVSLEIEARRARQFGFTASELDRTKRTLMAAYEQAYAERDKSDSSEFAQELLSLFLRDEPAPGIEYEYRLVAAILPDIALDEVSAMARSLMSDDGRVALATSPQKEGLAVPTEAALRTAIGSSENVAVTAWSDTSATRPLVEKKPAPGTVVSRREIGEVGVTVLTLSNGVEVWLKPTTFKNDQILFTLNAPGGASLAPPPDFDEAVLAPSYVRLSGLQGLKALDLEKMLAGKVVSAAPSISLSSESISGNSVPADLETALQLLYENFVAPGDDPDQFEVMKRQLSAAVANRGRSPMQVFAERVEQINTSNHYTAQPLTTERIQALDRAKMLSFYRDRFSNASGFTFFMVGAFKVDEALPLIAQYVGGLPSKPGPAPQFRDVGVHFPQTSERDKIELGREPRSNVVISFFADPLPDPVEVENVTAATTVLDIALRDILREELGQTYTVSVGLSQQLPQRGGGYIRVSFGAAPENVSAMTDRVFAEVRRMQQEGPSVDLTNRAKESARRNYETALQQNGYWLGRLQFVRMFDRDPKEIVTRPARIDAVTPQTVQNAFRTYFPADRYTVVTLMPAPTATTK